MAGSAARGVRGQLMHCGHHRRQLGRLLGLRERHLEDIVVGRTGGPGGFADQLADQYALEPEAAIEHFVNDVRGLSAGRLGTPEDVARVIALLLSPASAQITGSEYAVDGGARHEI